MADEKLTNRWLMVVAALVMQLCLEFSIRIRVPRAADEGSRFTVKQAGYPYMASLFFFAVGMIVAGRWQDKAGPKRSALWRCSPRDRRWPRVRSVQNGRGWSSRTASSRPGRRVCLRDPDRHLHQVVPRHARTITGLAVFGFGAGTLVFGR